MAVGRSLSRTSQNNFFINSNSNNNRGNAFMFGRSAQMNGDTGRDLWIGRVAVILGSGSRGTVTWLTSDK